MRLAVCLPSFAVTDGEQRQGRAGWPAKVVDGSRGSVITRAGWLESMLLPVIRLLLTQVRQSGTQSLFTRLRLFRRQAPHRPLSMDNQTTYRS